MKKGETISNVFAALEREPSANLHRYPIQMDLQDNALVMEGEVENIRAKKRILEVAVGVPGVVGIVDRLVLAPAERMQDGEIRDHVSRSLSHEKLLEFCAIWAIVKGKPEVVRETGTEIGSIDIEVNNGVVVLNGSVSSLSEKRLAGVLAWWVPGSRDVINGIDVLPPEEDNDDEVVDALRLVLEKEPFINSSQIKLSCKNYIVTLEGLVKNEAQRQLAEADAWFLFGVDGVSNQLMVEE